MAIKNRPARFAERRAGEIVLGGTLPLNTRNALSQRVPDPTRIRFYRVDRWLTVCEVRS